MSALVIHFLLLTPRAKNKGRYDSSEAASEAGAGAGAEDAPGSDPARKLRKYHVIIETRVEG